MKKFLLHPILLAALVAFPVNAFASAIAEHFKQNFKETTAVYPAPKALDSDPQHTGLLLVDAVTKKALNTMSLDGVVIANVLEPEKELQAGTFKTGGALSQMSNVVVFSNLRPGTYKIVKIKTSNANMWEVLPLPVSKEFEVQIEAGKLIYLGQIQVRHPMGTTERKITLNYDKAREKESWQKVTAKFNDSIWVNIINEQVNRIQ